jgi:type IV secretion system protein TrbF
MTFKRSALRYGVTPPPSTPFQRAGQAWDDRIGSPHVQARNWRLFAFGCVALSFLLLGSLIWQLRGGAAPPYVVEIDRSGAVRTVGPALSDYTPTDAQIAFHLARFVEQVRALSIDPVVVRQNWLRAYDFATDRAAITLNEHAREHDPFANVGRMTVAVEVQSVVRASETSFQIRWLEKSFDNGVPKATSRMTGIFSIVMTPPRTAETIRKNPLGIYVHAFNWTPDHATGDKP